MNTFATLSVSHSLSLQETLKPVGKIFVKGETAVAFANSTHAVADARRVLAYWDALLKS